MQGKARDPRGASLDDLEALYRRRFHDFHRVATALLRDADGAYDAVQDGFAAAVRRRGSFRGEGSLDAWVGRIVVNAARTAARRIREPTTERGLSANGTPGEEDIAVRSALALLPERQRLMLFFRYYTDLDYATIAQLLGVRVGTVSSTLNSARAALEKLLKEVPS